MIASAAALGLAAASAPAQQQPASIQVSLDGNWIWLGGFTPGSVVLLSIDSSELDVTIDGSGGSPDAVWLVDQLNGLDVVPGMTITASDGTTTKTLHTADVRITSVDALNEVVTGTAPANATMMVYIADGPWQLVELTADASGNWRAQFDVSLADANNIQAAVIDEDGDQTFWERPGVLHPWLSATIDGDGIDLERWAPASTVTVTIDGVSHQFTVADWGTAFFEGTEHGQDIVPGSTITASDGSISKTLHVVDLRITVVDAAADTVSGTAPAGSEVTVVTYPPGPKTGGLSARADAAGHWTVSFAGRIDLQVDMGVAAQIADGDGDMTRYFVIVSAGPLVDAGGPYTVPEGSTIALAGGATGGQTPFKYEWTGAGDLLDNPTRATPTFSAPEDATFTLTLTVTDAAGASGSDEATVTVTNRPPLVSPPLISAGAKRTVTIAALFADPGRLDTHTAQIQWGDGTKSSGTLRELRGTGAVTASHQFARKGTYTVTLTVRDDDGGQATVQRQISIH